MSGSLDKSSGSKTFPSVQVIVLSEVAWALAALLFFLVFSVRLPGQEQPIWYSLGTSIFEIVAFLVAAVLCFRNYRSPQIVSGRSVWLWIGLGMLFYGIGSILFTWWETGLGRDAAVSLGDFLYVPAYVFIVIGVFLAVRSRRLNLVLWQWVVLAAIAVAGTALAFWLTNITPADCTTASQRSFLIEPVAAQTAPASSKLTSNAAPKASFEIAQQAKPTKAPTAPNSAATTQQTGTAAPNSATTQASEPAPEWVTNIEGLLAPFEGIFGLFYVIADVVLLIIATALLLAFWGGRFALSWRMIAAAAFSYYIADMWFEYATDSLCNYQSGSLPEVFWIFSPVLFGIGAALEYDLSSSRSRRAGGRRRG